MSSSSPHTPTNMLYIDTIDTDIQIFPGFPLFQPPPQIPSSAIRTEAVTFNCGINAERDPEVKCAPILGQKLGSSSRSPAFLLALAVLVTVVAMSALPASCEKASASAGPADHRNFGEELSRPQRPESRMLASRPRQPRLTKEWRQQRQQVKLLQQIIRINKRLSFPS